MNYVWRLKKTFSDQNDQIFETVTIAKLKKWWRFFVKAIFLSCTASKRQSFHSRFLPPSYNKKGVKRRFASRHTWLKAIRNIFMWPLFAAAKNKNQDQFYVKISLSLLHVYDPSAKKMKVLKTFMVFKKMLLKIREITWCNQ